MHKRKSVLVNSSALFSLKLCIFFRLFSSFFRLFSSFFYLFLSFSASFCPFFPFPVLFCPFYPFYILSAFLTLPCLLLSFYILIHILFTLSHLFASYSALFRNHLFLIFYSYKAFFRLYRFIFYSCLILALIIFYLSLLPLFLSPLSLCVPFYLSLNSLLYLLLFLFMCSLCSDLIF